ncbi:MAG: glycosyltransferase family 39 protein [Candidatus Korobacteraceae bacterium]
MVLPKQETQSSEALLSRSSSRVWQLIAVCIFFWILAAALQWSAGVFGVEFGGHPDEAAHYVTGVMLRDYVAGGHFTSPRTFVEQYYSHYPKIGLFVWPPLFHGIEAIWDLVFNPSKPSALLLEALLTALLATSIYWVIRRQYPAIVAFAGGAVFVLLPLVRISTQTVMADGLVALLIFWATIAMIRYLETERTRDAIWFGVFAGLAMATKPNGLALVLLPPIAILITRRFYLLKRPALYYAAAIALVLGLPWEVLSYKLMSSSLDASVGVTPLRRLQPVLFYGRILVTQFGWALLPFCIIGIAIFLVTLRRRERVDLTLSGALALLLSVWIFHSGVSILESRYMLSAMPAMMLFTVAGGDWVVRRIPTPRASLATRSAILGAILVVLVVAQPLTVPRKPYWGLDKAAQYLVANKDYPGAGFLIVADASGEGAFVSEVVMRDDRPDHFVLRSTKVLISTTWFGANYQTLYPTPDALRNYLDHAPISAVVLDTGSHGSNAGEKALYQLQQSVAQALASDPNWRPADGFPQGRADAYGIQIYTRIGPQPAGDVQLNLRYTLGTNLVVHNNTQPAGRSASSKGIVLGARILAAIVAIAVLIVFLRRKPAATMNA